MHYTLEALLKGQETILEYYGQAKTKWQEIFADKAAVAALPERITEYEKDFFEPECGGMFIGREVMAWSAFASLYSIQFGWQDDRLAIAQTLVKSFAESTCSDEAKEAAWKAALLYDVEKPKSKAAS